jgi:glutamate N-acetyltransferase/amino-acid N-acetyltransferase
MLRIGVGEKAVSGMIENSGIYSVPGFMANGVHAGLKENGRKDIGLIFSTVPAKAAGVFTRNYFKAAPVLLDMERIKSGVAQAIMVNSGNANAATGKEGYLDALAVSRKVSSSLHIDDALVLVASTGIIGHRLPVGKIDSGIDALIQGLHEQGIPLAAEAIMTTDKFPKLACRRGTLGTREVTLCGIAKGAGMIQPDMATMLAFIMTDAEINLSTMDSLFKQAVNRSFNAITVDGCTSTNDTVIIMANGIAGNKIIKGASRNTAVFKEMLFDVLSSLSQAIVQDGEGATKVIEIIVDGAKSVRDARKIAYAVGNSNLVKTAFYGGDPNWGRIISAAGSAGISLPVENVELFFEDIPVFSRGRGIGGNQEKLASIMSGEKIRVTLSLGMGAQSFRLFASDLTDEYIRINAHYHT